jgi:hypothetical protein
MQLVTDDGRINAYHITDLGLKLIDEKNKNFCKSLKK